MAILVWTKLRVSNGALEGMNNKVKVISHRTYGYRTTWTYMANIRSVQLPRKSQVRKADAG
jgi:transposase